MRPTRMLRYLLVAALFVTSVALTEDSGGVARAQTSVKPRMVATSPLGTINRRQLFQILVNQSTGEAIAYGYFMYIHGLDEEELYLNKGSDNHESNAFFNLYIEGRITRVHRNGTLLVFELKSQSVISFDPNPDGNFLVPGTFKNGIRIATGDENATFTYDLLTGDGTGDVRLRQTGVWPFEFKGELIQFGEVGNHNVSWRGKTLFYNPFGWTLLFITATTVQAAPVPTTRSEK